MKGWNLMSTSFPVLSQVSKYTQLASNNPTLYCKPNVKYHRNLCSNLQTWLRNPQVVLSIAFTTVSYVLFSPLLRLYDLLHMFVFKLDRSVTKNLVRWVTKKFSYLYFVKNVFFSHLSSLRIALLVVSIYVAINTYLKLKVYFFKRGSLRSLFQKLRI